MLQIKKGVVNFKKTLNPLIKELIIKILVLNPIKRPKIEDILTHPLKNEIVKEKSFYKDGLKPCFSTKRMNSKEVNLQETPVLKKIFHPNHT